MSIIGRHECSIRKMFTWDFDEDCLCIQMQVAPVGLSPLRNLPIRNYQEGKPVGAEIKIVGVWLPIIHSWRGAEQGHFSVKFGTDFKPVITKLAQEIQRDEGRSRRIYGMLGTPYIKPLKEIQEDQNRI